MTDKGIRRLRAARRLKIARDNYAIEKSKENVIRDDEAARIMRRLYESGQSVEFIVKVVARPIDLVREVLNMKDDLDKGKDML